MEDIAGLLPKLLETGALGVICALLIFRGIPAMNELSSSISKLADKVGVLDGRMTGLERISDNLYAKVDKLEERVVDLARIHEDLHDLKVSVEDLARRIGERA